MNETRITCDTEVPMPTNHYDGRMHQNYSLPYGRMISAKANKTDKQYDKPKQRNASDNDKVDNDSSIEIIGSSQRTATTTATVNCTHPNDSYNRFHSGIRNYDIPRDTINSNVLERLVFFLISIISKLNLANSLN